MSHQKKNKNKNKKDKRVKKFSLSTDKINSKNTVNTNQNIINSFSKIESDTKKYSKNKKGKNKKENNNKKERNHNININIIPISNMQYSKTLKKKINSKKNNIYIKNNSRIRTDVESKSFEKTNFTNLNDQELNTLQYELALLYDKRNYFQYYWSLLKKKQLILFTFVPSNDYNLFSLKLSLFLISFSLYFTINAFFFSDETMHKIHESNGELDFFYQIPQILYSSLISAAINMILKLLSLSEKNILSIKKQQTINLAQKKSKKIKNCLIIKFIIFFLLSLILLVFFWYFISCFCAVFTNTQKILIKDTLVSFALSMVYPFGINLLPGMFRIPALKKNDRKCLYQIGNLVALI